METITREIIRNHDGHEAVYKFTTYPVIFGESIIRKPNFLLLLKYLREVFECEIPSRLKSPSSMPTLILQTLRFSDHEYIKYAKVANYFGLGGGQHWKLQEHFMMSNPYTMAVEAPVFDDDMLGNMDLLNYNQETDMVEILDFKPNAHKEKHAATQLYWYRELLSKQSGIPKSKIECFYFDDMNCYKVKF